MCVQCNEIWTHSGSLQETPNCILIYTLSILGITIIQFSYCNISDARFNLSIHRFVDAFTKEWHWMQLVIHLLFDWTIHNIAILMRHSDLIIYSSYYVLDDVIGLCQFRDNRKLWAFVCVPCYHAMWRLRNDSCTMTTICIWPYSHGIFSGEHISIEHVFIFVWKCYKTSDGYEQK